MTSKADIDTSVAKMLMAAEQAWAGANVNIHLKARPVTTLHTLEAHCLTPWEHGRSESCRTPLDFVPIVSVNGLPASRYPEFAVALVGPTMACLRLNLPHLWIALQHQDLVRVVTSVVAARAGFWAATNWVPDPDPILPGRALFYDVKRRNLWLAKSDGSKEHNLWLAMLSLSSVRMRNEEEVVHCLSAASPALAITGAVTTTQSGAAFTVTLMRQRFVAVLKHRMSPTAFSELAPDRADIIDAIRLGPLTRAPLAAVLQWARDPLMALQAHRRLATTSREVADLRYQEEELRSAATTPAASSRFDIDDDPYLEAALFAGAKAASAEEQQRGAPVEPTVLNGGDDTPRPGTPVSAEPQWATQDSPGDENEPLITPEDAGVIREIATHAQQTGRLAPSALMGAMPDESVKW